MFNTDVSSPSEFPVDDTKRWSTDVCCTVISALFAIILFVLACLFFNTSKTSIIQIPSTRPISPPPAHSSPQTTKITSPRCSGLLSLHSHLPSYHSPLLSSFPNTRPYWPLAWR